MSKNYTDPNDADNTYTWYDFNPDTNGGFEGTSGDGTDTEDFLAALNAEMYGGFSDWRLPTIEELSSIVHLGKYNPAIETIFFPATFDSEYWASNTLVDIATYAWYMNFGYGDDYVFDKSSSFYVRAVRGGQKRSSSHWVVNNDGTVTDTNTGLMWQQSYDDRMSWQSALDICENKSLAGFDDWRLPTLRELRSIVDYASINPSIDTNIFPNTATFFYWSCTSYAAHTYGAWRMTFGDGKDSYNAKTSTFAYHVRAVRGGQNRLADHLVIFTPAQASLWDIGVGMPIRWDTSGLGGNVNISLSRDGGKTFTQLAETENKGTYLWNVIGALSL